MVDDSEARDYARKWAWTTAWQAQRYFDAAERAHLPLEGELGDQAYFENFTRVWSEIHFLMIAAGQLDLWLGEAGEDHDLSPESARQIRVIRNCMEHWNEARRGEGPSIKQSDDFFYGRFQMASWIGRNAPLFGNLDVHELITAARAIEGRLRE